MFDVTFTRIADVRELGSLLSRVVMDVEAPVQIDSSGSR